NASPSTYPYLLSLHDALPISQLDIGARGSVGQNRQAQGRAEEIVGVAVARQRGQPDHAAQRQPGIEIGAGAFDVAQGSIVTAFGDRKSTRLNSSHVKISYAVF